MIVERLFQLPQSNPPKYKVVNAPLFWLEILQGENTWV